MSIQVTRSTITSLHTPPVAIVLISQGLDLNFSQEKSKRKVKCYQMRCQLWTESLEEYHGIIATILNAKVHCLVKTASLYSTIDAVVLKELLALLFIALSSSSLCSTFNLCGIPSKRRSFPFVDSCHI